MTERSVIHDMFTIERTYPATPSRVFAAFASEEAKNIWGDTGDLEPPDGEAGNSEFDFRVGGRERFGHMWHGTTYRYDALYYDIVPEQRIVYSYEMYADDARISVSLATIEFAKSGEGTTLSFTEQGAFLDGIDGPGRPAAPGGHRRDARWAHQLPAAAGHDRRLELCVRCDQWPARCRTIRHARLGWSAPRARRGTHHGPGQSAGGLGAPHAAGGACRGTVPTAVAHAVVPPPRSRSLSVCDLRKSTARDRR